MLTGEQASEHLHDLIHLDTQAASYSLDLTVAEVWRLTGPGRLDFGGSEFEEASYEPIEPELYTPDDQYGWWELNEGTYRIRYNEGITLDGDHIAVVYPHERLLHAGVHHPAFQVHTSREVLETLLVVPERGAHLKENCRISTLLVVEA